MGSVTAIASGWLFATTPDFDSEEDRVKLGEVMAELERLGNEPQRNIYRKHGAKAEMFGVKVADLKVVARKLKGDQTLALDLYRTGNLDAMYLAGLVADGRKMSRQDLEAWARAA